MSISFGFVVIAFLSLWFIIGSKGNWLVKASIILASMYFCLAVGFSVKDYMGWPTGDPLPKKFLVHWIIIEEPNIQPENKGSIYMWVKPIENHKEKYEALEDYLISFYDGKSQPRAYRLEYSRELHKQAQEAIANLMQGKQLGGTNGGEGDGKRGGDSDIDGSKKQNGNGDGSLTRNGGIMFYELPPTKLPEKVGG
jgi:hypothetical protein